jgi:predicted hotdog family 3-hydroxylacyl-ACP dehydratase
MPENGLPRPENVLHHRGSALLLHEILEHNDEHTVASVDVSRQSWLKRQDAGVEVWVSIEYMAQCIAARAGLLAHFRNENLPRGFLIATHQLRFHMPIIEADSLLRVYAKPAQGRPGLGALSHGCAVYQVDAESEASLIAEGRLTVSTNR